MAIYLCHKCAGVLQGEMPEGSYGCGCMSGWVRDWYEPTAWNDVLEKQIEATENLLNLYKRQGRDPNCDLVKHAEMRLERLLSAEYAAGNI